MKICPKCQRTHSGICGIPPGVTLGFGARIGGIGTVTQSENIIKGKPKQKPKSASFLMEMLKQARGQEKKISDMLKVGPTELPEFDDLLDRLGKIEELICQLNWQIIERERK